MKIEFTLKFSRPDFEELYFGDSWDYELKLKKRKETLQTLVMTGIVTSFVLIYAINSDYFFTSVVCVIIFLYTFYNYGKAYKDMRDYTLGVDKYLNELATVNVFKVVLTDSFLSVIMDEKETIGAWSVFRNVFIMEKYVSLVGEHGFLIPAKSLSPDEYDLLKKFISEKFKSDDGVLDDRTKDVQSV